jgi:RNA recognition motif-containing protein
MSAEASSSSSPTANEIPPVPPGHSQLYLKNLSFSTTEDSLAAHVQSITGAKPHSTNIVTTKRPGKFQGRSRGFGFVTVVSSAANNLINKLNNVEFEGRVISVVEAKPRDPNAPRPERKPRQPRPPRNNDNNNNNNNDSKSESSSSS